MSAFSFSVITLGVYIKAQRSQVKNAVRSWDDAIRLAKRKIAELKNAISGFEMAKARGDEWPGTQADNQTSESCHGV
jgi:hypothetical protein